MKLPVYLYGHPVLRNESDDVDVKNYEGLPKLIDDMFETMYASEGIGLAAPQIGRNERIVVIDADVLKDQLPELEGKKYALINPEVTVLDGDKVTRSEGCLSLPGLSENVQRVEHIRLDWTDLDGNDHTEEIEGFLARIVQHECDHLDGMLYIDHVSPIRKQLIRKKLHNIVEGRVATDYPVKTAPRQRGRR